MRYQELLSSYLPQIIVQDVLNGGGDALPRRNELETVCLFADVSGFTRLSEQMTEKHGQRIGAEYLAKHLNSYFSQVVKIIGSEGGDVFKFAGDAMIVLWPISTKSESIKGRLFDITRRAIQCAVRVQNLGQDIRFDEDGEVTLSIKIGIGVGTAVILQIGGVRGRKEYIAIGEPMTQAFEAEHQAHPGDIILSCEAWNLMKDGNLGTPLVIGSKVFYEVNQQTAVLGRRYRGEVLNQIFERSQERQLQEYVPTAALQSLDESHLEIEAYASELRRVTILFINLGFSSQDLSGTDNSEASLLRVHNALCLIQNAIYRYEGSLNKFLMDDKGATLICVFGLPPFSHENDPKRSVSCALDITEDLEIQLQLPSNIGITTGTAFCGVLGSQMRREYSVLGDVVNLSARLMQFACTQSDERNIVTDLVTYEACHRAFIFEELGEIEVKGKKEPVGVFCPISYAQEKKSKKSLRHRPMGSSMLNISSQPEPKVRYSKFNMIVSMRVLNMATNAPRDDLGLYFKVPNFALSPSDSGSKTLKRLSNRLSAMLGGKSGHENKTGPPKPDQSTKYRKKAPLPVAAPEGASRSSLILYEPSGSVGNSHRKKTPEDISIIKQLAVGSEDVYFLEEFAREDIDQCLHSFLLARARQRSSIMSRIDGKDVEIMIQGTEFVIPSRLWKDNASFLGFKNGAPSKKQCVAFPMRYLEAFVTEALVGGEIWRSDLESSLNIEPLKRRVTGSKKNSGGSDQLVDPRFPQHEIYVNDEGNGGTCLKFILVPKSELCCLQSSSSKVMRDLMTRKIELLEFGKGSVTVISGDPGIGKTHLLQRFLSGFLKLTVPVFASTEQWGHSVSDYDILYSEKTKERNRMDTFRNEARLFRCWFDVLRRWLDLREAACQEDTDRLKFRMKLIKEGMDPTRIVYASLLNEDLDTKFMKPAGAAAQALGSMNDAAYSTEVVTLMKSIIVDLICHIANSYKGVIILVDDAMRLDEASWDVSLQLTRLVAEDRVSLMMIYSSRPFEGNVDRSCGLDPVLLNSATRQSLISYRRLCNHELVRFCSLTGMSDIRSRIWFRKCLGVTRVEEHLWDLCKSRCFNNPLLIQEFAFELKISRRPKVIEFVNDVGGGTVASLRVKVHHLCETAWGIHAQQMQADSKISQFQAENEKRGCKVPLDFFAPHELEPPATAVGVLTARVDRLTPMEQMVLKLACLTSNVFSLRLLEDVYPSVNPNTKTDLKNCCESLADEHGILQKVRANAYNDEYVYRVADIMLVATIRQRLLSKHRNVLIANIARAHAKLKSVMQYVDLQLQQKKQNHQGSNFHGILKVRRRGGLRDWKERYAILTSTSLLLFKKNPYERASEDEDADEVIKLLNAQVALETSAKKSMNSKVFHIECKEFIKKAKREFGSGEKFTFSCANREIADTWISRLSLVIGRLKLENLLSATKSNARKTSFSSLVPIRRRSANHMSDILEPKQMGFKIELEQIRSDSKWSLMGGPTDVYVSISLRMPSSYRTVRKQSTLTAVPVSKPIQIKEGFFIVLEPENLIDWSDILQTSEDQNSYIDFVFWKQTDDALYTDGILGFCSLSIPALFSQMGKSKNRVSKEVAILQPYKHGKNRSWLEVSFKIESRDLNIVSTLKSKRKQVVDWAKVSRTVYDRNAEFILKSNRARGDSSNHIEKIIEAEPVLLKEPVPIIERESLADRGHLKHSHSLVSNLLRAVNADQEDLRRTGSLGFFGTHPVDNTIAHLDFLLKHEKQENRKSEIEYLKQVLLSKSFSAMVGSVVLDENSRKWLGEGFTKEASISVKKDATNVKDSMDYATNSYLSASQLELFFIEEGQKVGPYPISFYTSKLAKGLIDEDTKVTQEDEEMPLGKHLEKLEIKALAAARAASKWKAKLQSKQPGLDPEIKVQTSPRVRKMSLISNPTNMHTVDVSSWSRMETSFSRFVTYKDSEDFSLDISDWGFDLRECPYEFRALMVGQMFMDLGIHEEFAIPIHVFVNFVERVEESMMLHDNPYHNFDHACDVAQAAFVLLGRMEASKLLTPLETFALMIAAFCHDLEHPGLNNAYQVKAKSKLAIQYEDQSVLEYHHAACAFRILEQEDSKIGDGLTAEEFIKLKTVVVESILATDMTCHFGLTGDLRNCVISNFDGASDPTASSLETSDRLLIAKILLHCADISNPTRTWEVTQYWQYLVVEEFFSQGDSEKENGWDISANMDRDNTKIEELSLNFIDFIVAPLFFAMHTFLKKAESPCVLMAINRRKWNERLQLGNQEESVIRQWESRDQAFEAIFKGAGFSNKSIIDYDVDFKAARRSSLYALEKFVDATANEPIL